MNKEIRYALTNTAPVLIGFLFLGISYGIYMQKLGFSFWYPMLMASTVFSGSAEFLIANLLLQKFHPMTVLIVTLLVNSRHLFYGITMIKKYAHTGFLKPWIIFGMCDESFSINATLDVPEDFDKGRVFFFVTIFNYLYWVLGATLGGIFGSLIEINFKGMDFVMTALFITLFAEQLLKKGAKRDALMGAGTALVMLLLVGKNLFLLASLLMLVFIFSLNYWRKEIRINER